MSRRGWTLRSRLVLLVAALAAVALLAANVAGVVLIRTYLLDRVDRQLQGMSRPLTASPDGFSRPGRRGLGPDQVSYFYDLTGAIDPIRSSTPDVTRPPLEGLATMLDRAATGRPYTVAAGDGSADWRMIAVVNADTGFVGVIGLSLAEVEQTTDRLVLIDAAVTVLILVLLGAGAAFVVRLGLRPLTAMEDVAAEITAGNLSGRVADPDPHTEPGRLGVALNAMLARIETEMRERAASEQRLRQFVADASHELRTPLTSIRGFAELYRRGGAPPGPALDVTMSRIESEAGRMGVLVEDMLLLARLDQRRPPARNPVDLLAIAADTIRDAHARTPGRPVQLAGLAGGDDDMFEPATVLGDEHGLRQVAANLVSNALQHTREQTRITVRVGCVPAREPHRNVVVSGPVAPPTDRLAVVEVSDDGPGVPQEHAPRVFERLYRADSSRTRGRGGGSGLGLAIVAAIVHGHGGWVELETPAGGGATFRVLLPAAALPAVSEPVPS